MTRPDGSPLRVIHRIRSRGDAGCDAQLVVMSPVVVVVSVINQPISGGKPVVLAKSKEQHTPAIVLVARQNLMTPVMGVGLFTDPVGSRADSCNGNESSRTDPPDIREGSEGSFGGSCCGRCFHWSRLFKTLVSDCRQKSEKMWPSGLF